MIAQIFRWLIFIVILIAILAALFVAWWLAVLIILGALVIGALRRLFGGQPPEQARGEPVILEGEYTEVDGEIESTPRNRDGTET